MTRWESESSESMYGKCVMGTCANGVKCGGCRGMGVKKYFEVVWSSGEKEE